MYRAYCYRYRTDADGCIQLKGHIYQLVPESSNFIGKPSLGHISNYYLGEPPTDEEVAAIQEAAEKLDISVLNTR